VGDSRFDAAALDGVEGWLSDEQARVLGEAAAALHPPARVVEIGSFRGRSTIVLAQAATEGVELIAIDPHAGTDRGPQEIETTAATGESDHERFLANLERAGVRERVRHVRSLSQDALAEVDGEVDLLYVDGAHRYRPARDDIVRWGARVKPGGTMLIHDSFSSIGVTAAILRHLVWNRDFDYVDRTASLAEYRRSSARPGNARRQLAQLPWFARNLLVKISIVLRLRRSREWPY
jgi:predicted O-methyltransferase YrrM